MEQEDLKKFDIHKPEEIRAPDEIQKEFSIEELKETISWSTRKIKFIVNNEPILFHLVNLSEKKKYGTKTSEKLDENLGLCSNASLSLRDNQLFLTTSNFEGRGRPTKKEQEQGMNEKIISKTLHSGIKKGAISIDEDGDFVHKKYIERFDEEGKKLEIIPSNLYLKNSPTEIQLEQVIDINDALDHDVKSRYILFPVEEGSDDNFRDLLYDMETSEIPKFLAFKFNYFPSYEPMDAFIQMIEENDNEYILINVGNKIDTKYFGMKSSIGDMIEIDDDFEFDLSL